MSTTDMPSAPPNDPRAQRAGEVGREWAASVRSDLHREGRPAAGGWPGTLSEARTRVGEAVPPGESLSREERERLVRVLYDAARDLWLAHRERAED